jgi:hypothetical protein
MEVFRSCVMTGLLKEAFEKASMLPEVFQDEIARDLLADIQKKENWDDFDIALMDGLPGEKFDPEKI